mmetsp:Transcript_29118/g.68124  ORF Transcript_29118/g.68124 Transcript_29118/m.68124 type:complete len:163 (+) Transcript_29118:84-572(+)|eukprot:CAMPEP_0169465506 /NCGR_PEP_ID=MMETSP1042-20121227/21252_1 /TAXON_ID=464988 /ORGANISM="Hemiselmis andersenii, Strain CCMP1180" /LENGTH=162 /DNA_ID=CAMNT_0009578459 /DNA_START=67 /DNA_END=555 /DNA_ORIENTATION=+
MKALTMMLWLTALLVVVQGEETFQVVFPSGVAATGQLMTQSETLAKPSVAAPSLSATGSDQYTIMMWDPDAPSPESATCRSWLHWMIVDATGSHLTGGETKVEYAPPTPPIGVHNYHVALYKQTASMSYYRAPASRCQFHPAAFASSHGLEMVAETTFRVSA